MNWTRALAECAHVMREHHEVREAGFTEAALALPRDDFMLRLLCAFNGAPAGWPAPRGWRYFPNAESKKAWIRVEGRFLSGGGPLDLARAYAPCVTDFANEPMRKAWERVHAAAQRFVESESIHRARTCLMRDV